MRVDPHLWGVVLSGGEGVRLKALTHQICGDERPKQYVPVIGNRTLLRQTLDRVALRIRPFQTAVVTLRSHSRFFGEQWAGPEPPRVLIQPTDRGTAAGILFPIHWIARQDPDAIVAVFPSDHFVSEPATFMAFVARIAAWVHEHPARLVLLGAHPTSPEVEYGWIELGRPLDWRDGRQMWEVRRFWEKPAAERARLCLEAGCLWNTLVLVGTATTFLRAAREAVPEVCERLARAVPFFESDAEAWAQAFALIPRADFSRAILESCPPSLAVAAVPRLMWSDLGSPRRVLEILGAARSLHAGVVAPHLSAS
jgi:mannose-1-phosphate guanylyltransferase